MTEGKLFIVPTPLGNLGDMTPRAIDALRGARTICAEDTRVTGRLLAAFDIHVPLLRMDEQALTTQAEGVIERVLDGETIAYCSDAGMPGVSDPGQRLIALAHTLGAPVEVLPGGTAVATAYVASGFTCPQFFFGGFMERRDSARRKQIEAVSKLPAVLLFYDSPHRVADSLEAIATVFPQRKVAVCRELTKLHEEVFVDRATAVAEEFARRRAGDGIKGEIVIVIDAPDEEEHERDREDAAQAAADVARDLVAAGGLTKKDIVKKLQADFGLARNVAYELVHGA